MSKKGVASSNGENFERVLSKKDIMALAFGAMIGWGWVVLTGQWIKGAGSLGAMLAFVIGGIMVLFVGLTYAELTSAMPKCGGDLVFSYRALGRTPSFICTWAIILGYISVVAFEAVAFPTVLENLFSFSYMKGYMYTIAGCDIYGTFVLIGSGSALIITAINYFGAKPAAFMQGVVTFMIACVGILLFGGSLFNGSIQNIHPTFVNGGKGILAVTIMTPFMYVGFDVIPQAAEEINVPFKEIGKIIILSVIMAVLWYVMIIYSTSISLNSGEIASSNLVAADAMKKVFGGSVVASKILILAGIGGIITSWNSFFIGGSRAIYSMAEAGMLPKFLAKIHPKYKTPTNAILLIGLVSSIAPFFGENMLVWLNNCGGFGILLCYLIVSISFLVLRKKEPNMVRPYKVKHPKFVGGMAMILCLSMLVMFMPGFPASLSWPYEWGIIIMWFAIGDVLYLFARHKEEKVKLPYKSQSISCKKTGTCDSNVRIVK